MPPTAPQLPASTTSSAGTPSSAVGPNVSASPSSDVDANVAAGIANGSIWSVNASDFVPGAGGDLGLGALGDVNGATTEWNVNVRPRVFILNLDS